MNQFRKVSSNVSEAQPRSQDLPGMLDPAWARLQEHVARSVKLMFPPVIEDR
jgi:hypothetical protein